MMRPVYESLGLSVAVVTAETPPHKRAAAYAADITYGTAKEFGFDFLRDRLQQRQQLEGGSDLLGTMTGTAAKQAPRLMRGLHFALIDEADSILIDEARTPLIISAPPGPQEEAFVEGCRWGASVAARFAEGEHYEYDPRPRTVTLNAAGRELVRALPKPTTIDSCTTAELYKIVERAIKVARDSHRD